MLRRVDVRQQGANYPLQLSRSEGKPTFQVQFSKYIANNIVRLNVIIVPIGVPIGVSLG